MNIDNLFDSSIKSKITITDILVNRNKWTTVNHLHELSEFSESKVFRYLDEIGEELKKKKFRGIELKRDRSKGVKLTIENWNIYNRYKKNMIRENWIIKLGLDLLLGNEIGRTKFIQTYYLSEATFNRRIKILRSFFSSYEINLKIKRGYYLLEGDESSIRVFANKVFWNLYDVNDWPFQDISEDAIKEIFRELTPDIFKDMSQIKKRQQMFILSIQVSRAQKGKIIKFVSEAYNYLKLVKLDRSNKKLYSLLPKIEYQYFFIRFLCYPRGYKNYELINMIQNEEFIHTKLFKFTEATMFMFASLLKITEKKELEKLRNFLYATHFHLILHPNWNDEIFNIQSELRPEKLITILKSMIKEVNREYLPEVQLNTTYLIRKYILIYAQFESLVSFEDKIVLQLDTSYGVLVENIIARSIYGLFADVYNLEIKTLSEEGEYFDILVTNNNFAEEFVKIEKQEIVYLTNQFTIKDLIEIDNSIKKIKNVQK